MSDSSRVMADVTVGPELTPAQPLGVASADAAFAEPSASHSMTSNPTAVKPVMSPIAPPTASPAIVAAPSDSRDVPRAAAAQNLIEVRNKNANWFFWIVGLSIVNTILTLAGDHHTFYLGITATILADAVGVELHRHGASAFFTLFNFGLDATIFGLYFACGWLGREGSPWAFIVGGAFFMLDTFLLLVCFRLFNPAFFFISLFIHARVLFAIFFGWTATSSLKRLEIQLQAQPS